MFPDSSPNDNFIFEDQQINEPLTGVLSAINQSLSDLDDSVIASNVQFTNIVTQLTAGVTQLTAIVTQLTTMNTTLTDIKTNVGDLHSDLNPVRVRDIP